MSIRIQILVLLVLTLLVGAVLNVAATVALMGPHPAAAAGRGAEPAPGEAQPGQALEASRGLRGEGRVRVLLWYFGLNAIVALAVGMLVSGRSIARRVEGLASAAERIGRLELDDPFEGRPSLLGPLGFAFERMAANLKAERARVERQIAELERLNRQLSEARDSLVRSEKLATVGRLAAGVAHEVGNPLGAILGYLELARDKSPGAAEYLAAIDREVGRIDRTVRELLDFSRPAQDAELRPVPLREAVGAAVRLASVQKRLRNVEFDVDLDPSLQVWAEPHHLSQVLVNVLLNAGDAMQEGGRIEIRHAPGAEVAAGRRASDPPAGPRVELSIADSGPGVAAEDLPRIFDPFFTTKEPGAGTGLGLAICHRILETFGGEIRGANRPEGGAVFTLVLRLARLETRAGVG